MDCGMCIQSPRLFGTQMKYIAVTWLGSMLLRLCFGVQTGTKDKTVAILTKDESPFESLVVLGLCLTAFSVYWTNILKKYEKRNRETPGIAKPISLFELKGYTLSELRSLDGSNGAICIALNSKIFDVTKDKKHYDSGGCYKMLAGRDASRAFATLSFDVTSLRPCYDDLADLNDIEKSNLHEWENIYKEKYNIVGKIVKEHKPKSLEDIAINSIVKSIELSQSNTHSIEQLPLPTTLKRELRNFFYEYIDQ